MSCCAEVESLREQLTMAEKHRDLLLTAFKEAQETEAAPEAWKAPLRKAALVIMRDLMGVIETELGKLEAEARWP